MSNLIQQSQPLQAEVDQIIGLYNQGQLEQTVSLAESLANQYPNALILYDILGAAYMGLKNSDKTIESYQKALQLNPNHTDAYNNMGMAFYDQGRFDEAVESYKKVINLEPNFADVHYNLGNALKQMGDLKQAIESYKTSLALKPNDAEVLLNCGNALKSYGDFEQAIEVYTKTLEVNPNFTVAKTNLDNAIQQKAELEKLVIEHAKVYEVEIGSAESENYTGTLLKGKGFLNAAVDSFNKAIKIDPDYAEAYFNIAIVLQINSELDAAIDSYKQALTLNPDYFTAYFNMGTALKGKGDVNAAIDSYKRAVKIKPDFAEAHCNLGNALKSKGCLDAALTSYKLALKIKPKHAKANFNMGLALDAKGELLEAIVHYKKALECNPDDELGHAHMLNRQARICDWTASQQDTETIHKLGTRIQPVEPLSILPLEDAPDHHKIRSEFYARNKYSKQPLPLGPRPSCRPKRLRIGYFSGDLKRHPVAYLIAKVIESHDRDKFEIYGFSIGSAEEDEMRRRLIKGFDTFFDVKDMNDKSIAMLAKQNKIDIAIDLTGYTSPNRFGIFSYRAAPVQINYLGYPGTLGADFIDYIIADQNLIPIEYQKYYSEKPIYLPDHYQAQDDTLRISRTTPSRCKLGLPDKGFIFCAINNTYKITPSEFNIWMRLLHHVDGSVLWLLESNKWAKANLQKEASARGVKPERLVFAQKVSHENYLAQFRRADLYLDTFIYNAGATASNALWAGLPVLTKLGKGYTARMAGSLLASLGLPELITTTEKEYEELALKLATNPERLASIKQKLSVNRLSKPLFSTKLFTTNLEKGLSEAYQRYFEEKGPDVIYVSHLNNVNPYKL